MAASKVEYERFLESVDKNTTLYIGVLQKYGPINQPEVRLVPIFNRSYLKGELKHYTQELFYPAQNTYIVGWFTISNNPEDLLTASLQAVVSRSNKEVRNANW